MQDFSCASSDAAWHLGRTILSRLSNPYLYLGIGRYVRLMDSSAGGPLYLGSTERVCLNIDRKSLGVRHFSRFLRSGSPNCWHCETPLYAARVQIFILRTLIWGTRGVKARPVVQSVWFPTLAQRTRKNGAPPAAFSKNSTRQSRWRATSQKA